MGTSQEHFRGHKRELVPRKLIAQASSTTPQWWMRPRGETEPWNFDSQTRPQRSLGR